MSEETAEFFAMFQQVAARIFNDNEQRDLRKARLEMAVALIKQGVQPDKAVVQAKLLVVTLFAPVSD